RGTIRIDRQIALESRGRFARVYVEVDLRKTLLPVVGVEDNWLKIEYEGIPIICLRCGCTRHDLSLCTIYPAEANINTTLMLGEAS
ncbi:hypothetical protein LINPERPRIM_LOCUS6680, partial [Linum perenne]